VAAGTSRRRRPGAAHRWITGRPSLIRISVTQHRARLAARWCCLAGRAGRLAGVTSQGLAGACPPAVTATSGG